MRKGKSWKKQWFVIIEQILYIYAASEDVAAIKTIPILGWSVEKETREVNSLKIRFFHPKIHVLIIFLLNFSLWKEWMKTPFSN